MTPAKMKAAPAPIALRAYDIKAAAAAYSVSVDTIKLAIKESKLVTKRTGENGGGKHLMTPEALDAWFNGLESG